MADAEVSPLRTDMVHEAGALWWRPRLGRHVGRTKVRGLRHVLGAGNVIDRERPAEPP